jgi:hypothetical protein
MLQNTLGHQSQVPLLLLSMVLLLVRRFVRRKHHSVTIRPRHEMDGPDKCRGSSLNANGEIRWNACTKSYQLW